MDRRWAYPSIEKDDFADQPDSDPPTGGGNQKKSAHAVHLSFGPLDS